MEKEHIDKFLKDGWVILDIAKPDVIFEFSDMLEKKVREICGSECSLKTLHEHVDDAAYKNLHTQLAQYFWDHEFSIKSAEAFLPILKEMIGLDIMVQYMPYLRLARPNKSEDNIGYHKDTQYGQTPYEIAVHVPFVDLNDDEALKVISGSHHQPESDYPHQEGVETHVEKGSEDHLLGKPYAPKKLSAPEGKKLSSLSMKVGQAAFFTPAIFHGQELNSGNVTRVTTDLRFVNTNTGLPIKQGKSRAGYVPIACSPVEQAAKDYYAAQPEQSANGKVA